MSSLEKLINNAIVYDVNRYDGNTLLNSVECYDAQTDAWELLDRSMTVQRCDAGVAVVRKS